MSLKSRPDGLDQKLILMPQQKTIILRTQYKKNYFASFYSSLEMIVKVYLFFFVIFHKSF
jgi:hypothetical protein